MKSRTFLSGLLVPAVILGMAYVWYITRGLPHGLAFPQRLTLPVLGTLVVSSVVLGLAGKVFPARVLSILYSVFALIAMVAILAVAQWR